MGRLAAAARRERTTLNDRRTTVPETLPPLCAAWASEVLSAPIPQETEATCSDCAMVCGDPKESSSASRASFFDPDTKCCTYLPVLPNFLVGQMLTDDTAEFARGRATVESRLNAGIGMTPLGLGRPASYEALYATNDEMLFGRSRSLRCPHYLEDVDGQCGIWRHRNAICATWFCKHVRGAVGLRFWTTLQRFLSAVERDLSLWCALELTVDSEVAHDLLVARASRSGAEPAALDSDAAIDKQRRIWGPWFGRQREFFRECAQLVDELRWQEVESICGPDVRAWARLTRDAFASLRSRVLPDVLRVGRFTVVAERKRSSIVETYSASDRLELPNALLEVLHHFDRSSSISLAVRTIRAQTGVAIERDLLRTLVDFEILVPPPSR